jgi:DNA-binding LytR/AlgR family response regulator
MGAVCDFETAAQLTTIGGLEGEPSSTMTQAEAPPTILLSAPESLQRRLQSFIAGRARAILLPEAAALGHLEKLPLDSISGVVLADETIDRDARLFARYLEQKDIPYLLATGSGHQAHLMFELSARDYILLTHPDEQVAATMQRFLQSLSANAGGPRSPDSDEDPDSATVLWVRSGHADRRIPFSEIRSISADRDYAVIELEDASLLVRATMASLEKELDDERFIRIHRSHIVATEMIRELRTLGPNRHEIRLSNGRAFPVGRTFWPGLKKQLRRKCAARTVNAG